MIRWDHVETVMLDMDGTLLDLHFDNYFWMEYVPQVYSETFGVPHEEARTQLHQRFESEKGSMQWYCLDYWSDELKLDIVNLKNDVGHKIQIRPHVEDFLGKLKNGHRQVLLVTNAHRGSLDLKMQKTRLDGYFHAMISTHDYGLPKEDLALWDALKNDFHFDPASTLLVDDTESVLHSARNYGIRHLVTLKQPDSQNAAREELAFPSILHFDEIMPHD